MSITILENNKYLSNDLLASSFFKNKQINSLNDPKIFLKNLNKKSNDTRLIILNQNSEFKEAHKIGRKIRDFCDIPIIIINRNISPKEKSEAINNGIDDLLISPYSKDELIARIHNLLTRSPHLLFKNTVNKINNLKIDIKNKEVTIDKHHINLTGAEYKILNYLTLNCNYIISKQKLRHHLFNDNNIGSDHIINMHIYNLRKKIKKGLQIKTIPSKGFVIRTT